MATRLRLGVVFGLVESSGAAPPAKFRRYLGLAQERDDEEIWRTGRCEHAYRAHLPRHPLSLARSKQRAPNAQPATR